MTVDETASCAVAEDLNRFTGTPITTETGNASQKVRRTDEDRLGGAPRSVRSVSEKIAALRCRDVGRPNLWELPSGSDKFRSFSGGLNRRGNAAAHRDSESKIGHTKTRKCRACWDGFVACDRRYVKSNRSLDATDSLADRPETDETPTIGSQSRLLDDYLKMLTRFNDVNTRQNLRPLLEEKAPSSSQPKSETDHNRSGQKHCNRNISTVVDETRNRSTDAHQKQTRVEQHPAEHSNPQNTVLNHRNSSDGQKCGARETVENQDRHPALRNCSENAQNPTLEKSTDTATANTTEPFRVIVVDAKDSGSCESAASDRRANEGRRNRALREILGLRPRDKNMLVALEL